MHLSNDTFTLPQPRWESQHIRYRLCRGMTCNSTFRTNFIQMTRKLSTVIPLTDSSLLPQKPATGHLNRSNQLKSYLPDVVQLINRLWISEVHLHYHRRSLFKPVHAWPLREGQIPGYLNDISYYLRKQSAFCGPSFDSAPGWCCVLRLAVCSALPVCPPACWKLWHE